MNEKERPAIALRQVTKHFRKRARAVEYTTLKSELVRLLKGQRGLVEPTNQIQVLHGLDLTVPRGKTVGIIGRNGSGKSTLLKIITGIYGASSGEVEVNGRVSALLELGAGFHPDFTGRENIFINGMILGMTRAELKDRVEEIIAFAELGNFIDEQVRTYSSGMFMRLAFAVATHVDPEILIIDEILSVGDEHFQKKSKAKMHEFRTSGRTILLVTHDLATVASWCDLAVWIDGGTVRMFGEPHQVVDSYKQAVEAAEADTESTVLAQPGAALPVPNDLANVDAVVQLVSVTTRADGEESTSPLSHRSSLRIDIAYLTRQDTLVDVRIRCLSRDDIVIFEIVRAAVSLRSGAGSMSLVLRRLSLVAGSYRLLVSIDGEHTTSRAAAPFEVHSPQRDVGMLELESEWHISQS
jgi:lipopolysaccharide transport system ATP-binding protein